MKWSCHLSACPRTPETMIEWGVKALSPIKRHMLPGTDIADGTRFLKVKFTDTVKSLPYSMKVWDGRRSTIFPHNSQQAECVASAFSVPVLQMGKTGPLRTRMWSAISMLCGCVCAWQRRCLEVRAETPNIQTSPTKERKRHRQTEEAREMTAKTRLQRSLGAANWVLDSCDHYVVFL